MLNITEAQSPFDEGNYTCIVENKCGRLQQDFFVKIIVRYLHRPIIRGSLKNQTVMIGGDAMIICKAVSDTPHFVIWRKVVGNALKEFNKTDKRIFFNETHLIIYNITESDYGQYMCYSANQHGSINRTAWISPHKMQHPELDQSQAELNTSYEQDTGNQGQLKTNYILIVIVAGVSILLICVIGFLIFCVSQRCYKAKQLFAVSPIAKQWEISRQNLKLFEPIGEGEFGIVYRGQITGTPDVCGYLNQKIVAVKTLKVGSTEKEMLDIFAEMDTMKNLGYHPNVIQFIGCCTMNGPFAVVMEYAAYGSLKNLLQFYKNLMLNDMESGNLLSTVVPHCHLPLDSDQLLRLSLQVAKGMEYLSSKKIVHRDVAARNVLVAENFVAKIADFGLTRNVTKSISEQYIPGRNRCLPIKWMSPESMMEKVFTTKSDVWSYGVLLWEIFTYGSNPYPAVTMQELLPLLKKGYRMEKPPAASEDLYQIMKSCWKFDPEDRPRFLKLVQQLELCLKTEDFLYGIVDEILSSQN